MSYRCGTVSAPRSTLLFGAAIGNGYEPSGKDPLHDIASENVYCKQKVGVEVWR